MATVLVVDDEQLVCEFFGIVLAQHGHHTLTAVTRRRALELYRQHRPDLTLLDVFLEDANGLDVLTELRDIDPCSRIVVLTAAASPGLEQEARIPVPLLISLAI